MPRPLTMLAGGWEGERSVPGSLRARGPSCRPAAAGPRAMSATSLGVTDADHVGQFVGCISPCRRRLWCWAVKAGTGNGAALNTWSHVIEVRCIAIEKELTGFGGAKFHVWGGRRAA